MPQMKTSAESFFSSLLTPRSSAANRGIWYYGNGMEGEADASPVSASSQATGDKGSSESGAASSLGNGGPCNGASHGARHALVEGGAALDPDKEEELRRLRETKEELEAAIERLVISSSQHASQLEEALADEVRSSEEERARLHELLTQKNEELVALREESRIQRQRADTLEGEKDAAIAEAGRLWEQTQDHADELKKMERELRWLRIETEAAKSNQAGTTSEIQQLKDQVEGLQCDLTKAREAIMVEHGRARALQDRLDMQRRVYTYKVRALEAKLMESGSFSPRHIDLEALPSGLHSLGSSRSSSLNQADEEKDTVEKCRRLEDELASTRFRLSQANENLIQARGALVSKEEELKEAQILLEERRLSYESRIRALQAGRSASTRTSYVEAPRPSEAGDARMIDDVAIEDWAADEKCEDDHHGMAESKRCPVSSDEAESAPLFVPSVSLDVTQ